MRFEIDPHSPFFNEPTALDQQLVDWSVDEKAKINTSGVTFTNTDSSRFYYSPDEGDAKTGLWVHIQGHGYTLLMLR